MTPPASPPRSPSWVHFGLFLATILTTTAAGAMYVHADGSVRPIGDGLPFSVPLLLILVCHEAGHYIVSRLHGVPASLPFFIPLPPPLGLFGTMGAVISMKSSTRDRRKLLDIGAAGPLAGLLVAIPVIAYGVAKSKIGPIGGGLQEGNSILYALIKLAVTGRWLPGGGQDVQLHPTALAGWAGLLVTMLNLMPFGQLDGGHVMTAYAGNRWSALSRRLRPVLLALAAGVAAWVTWSASRNPGRSDGDPAWSVGVAAALPWVVWYALLGLMTRATGGIEHPPVDDSRPLPRSRRVLFWVVAVAFLAVFMPVPLRANFGPADTPQRGGPPTASVLP